MRKTTWPLLGLMLLLTPALAAAQGVDLQSGQKVSATMEDSGGLHLFRFHAIEGDLITIQFSVPKKSELEPFLALLGPEDEFDLPDLEKGKMKLKKLLIPTTGLHEFLVAGAGSEGQYSFSFQQKHAKVETETRKIGAKYSLLLPADAKLKLTVKAAKGSDVYPGIDQILDPAGNDVLDPDLLKEKKKKAKVTLAAAPVFGWYTVYLTDRQGSSGDAIIKAKITPAKPFTKKLNEKTGFDCLVAAVRFVDDRAWAYELNAEVFQGDVQSAVLHFPVSSRRLPVTLTDDDGDLRYTGDFEAPDGIYVLVITLADGKVVRKAFHLHGEWPTEPALSIQDGSTATPTVSWRGHTGPGMHVIEIEEFDSFDREWRTEFFKMVPGPTTSFTVPDGPLDPVPHAVTIYSFNTGYRVTATRYEPDI